MEFEQWIWSFFGEYAYKPHLVYGGIIAFMTMSSFGLPLPEEVVLVCAGVVAYMALNPASYPPPTPDAQGVDLATLAIVCFFAVLLSDFLIYLLGRFLGEKIMGTKFFKKRIEERGILKKTEIWFEKYGAWACGVFRFTPGLRFPGHLSCGAMKVPMWKFLLIDGCAALISVPTQVILVAIYGEVIVNELKKVKMIVAGVILAVILGYFAYKFFERRKKKAEGEGNG